jgi:hypothetical protein
MTGLRAALVMVAALVASAASVRADVVIEDPVGDPDGEFGYALASSGDELAIGAPGARVSGQDDAGLVQLFSSDGTWLRRVQAPTPRTDARFGTAVAASDGLLYVGAPGDRPIGLGGLGAVYVFDVATGDLVRVLRPPASGASGVPVGGPSPGPVPVQSTVAVPEAAGFGRALAVAGDRIVVGAPDSLVGDVPRAGAVYVFDATGALVATLRDLSPAAGGRLGASATVIGDLLFAGAPGTPALGRRGAGVVQVFDLRRGVRLPEIISTGPDAGAAFGAATAGSAGGALIVGAPGDEDLGAAGAGTVEVFPDDAGALPTLITSPAPTARAGFGRAVLAIGGDVLVGADGAGAARSGAAYLVDPSTGVVRATFLPTTATPGGRFGFALALAGSRIAIGAPGAGPGRVFVFERGVGTGGAGFAPPPIVPVAACAPAASAGCRLDALVGVVTRAGLGRLATPLLRAQRDIRVAAVARERRRARAIRRANAQLKVFVRRVTRAVPRGVPLEMADDLVGAANALARDLGTPSAR